MVESVIFWAFAALTIGAGLGAVLNRSIVYAALNLIVVFLSIAGFFLLNNADFLALAQIIIYAVGLTIILLFAIMFTGDHPVMKAETSRSAGIMATIVAIYTLAVLVKAASAPFPVAAPRAEWAAMILNYGSTPLLGEQLFRQYALPFEAASILLLVAMVGAILIAKKHFVEHRPGETKLAVDLDSAPPPEAVAARNVNQPGQSQDRAIHQEVGIGPKGEGA